MIYYLFDISYMPHILSRGPSDNTKQCGTEQHQYCKGMAVGY